MKPIIHSDDGLSDYRRKDDMFAFTRVKIVLELLISCKLLLLSLCNIYIKKHHYTIDMLYV